MPEPSPYEVLGVSPEATASEIRSAFRDKVRASHPDTTRDMGDDRDVIEVVEAYRHLMARGAGNVAATAGRAEPTGAQRVEVRRAHSTSGERAEPPSPLSCPECRGRGFVDTRAICPECRGSGTITRLEAHRASVVACRRCRGRGQGRAREACSTCGGSGSIARSSS